MQNPLVIENHQKMFKNTKHEIIYSQIVGHSVEHARQILIDKFLKTDCEYYFTMDSDILFLGGVDDPLDRMLSLLVEKNTIMDIIGGLYFYKRPPCYPVFRPIELQEIYEKEGKFPIDYNFGIPNKPFEVCWIGNGFKMIKRRVIEEITKMIKVPNLPMIYKNEYVSEDWAFDQRARNLGFKVFVDPTMRLGHLGSYIYTQNDFDRYNGVKNGSTG